MVGVIVLCLNKIVYYGASCDYSFWKVAHAEAFQREGVEMPVQHLIGILVAEDPVVEHCEVVAAAKQVDEIFAFVALYEDF